MLSKCTLWANVGLHLTFPHMRISKLYEFLMLVGRRRRRANINPTLGERLVFVGYTPTYCHQPVNHFNHIVQCGSHILLIHDNISNNSLSVAGQFPPSQPGDYYLQTQAKRSATLITCAKESRLFLLIQKKTCSSNHNTIPCIQKGFQHFTIF